MGRLISAGGTLYIERERRRDAMRVVHEMAAALQAGQTVAVFPEGTVSDGHEMLPFHANLLQAAIATETPIQPVAIRYADATDRISRAADFSGTITIAQSLWLLACGEGVVARVVVLPAQGSAHADRRALAESLRAQIGATLETL
jgi:1-acyl-sn-glycerol-3-phosphate acyltransferase